MVAGVVVGLLEPVIASNAAKQYWMIEFKSSIGSQRLSPFFNRFQMVD